VCARYIPVTTKGEDGKRTTVDEQRAEICIDCGQCVAVCHNDAIECDNVTPQDCVPVSPVQCSAAQLLSVMAHRRSVRRYKRKPIAREVLDQVIEAVRWAPTATSASCTGVIVVDKPELLEQISTHLYALYDKADKGLSNPIGRFFMRRAAGPRNFATLRDFVMPGMRWYKRWYQEGTSNEILRDCRALMLFHAPVAEPSGDEGCVIAAWHAVLMAEVLGLGTCFNGLIPPPCNRVPELRELLGLDEDHHVYASVTMGYPKHKFKRTIRRRLAESRYLE